MAITGFLAVLLLLVVGTMLSVTPLGLWVIALALRCGQSLAGSHRRLVASLLDLHVVPPRLRSESGVLGWRRSILADPDRWRAMLYVVLKLPVSIISSGVVLLAWANGLLLASYPVSRLVNGPTAVDSNGLVRHGFSVAGHYLDKWPSEVLVSVGGIGLLFLIPWITDTVLILDRVLIRALLAPNRFSARIQDLEETRTAAVDEATETLRRIERDLHDGAQARLVALGMQLTMAQEMLATEAPASGMPRTAALLDASRHHAGEAILETRDLVRGIRPPVLDAGLRPALATLAACSAMPVILSADIPKRQSAVIETIAYFCAAERLTNAARHSGATRVNMDVSHSSGLLRLRVSDDGRGGAAFGGGSGLVGLTGRVRTVDGRLSITSPPGGPTVVTVDLPASA